MAESLTDREASSWLPNPKTVCFRKLFGKEMDMNVRTYKMILRIYQHLEEGAGNGRAEGQLLPCLPNGSCAISCRKMGQPIIHQQSSYNKKYSRGRPSSPNMRVLLGPI